MSGHPVTSFGRLEPSGIGGNSGQANHSYAIFQEAGAWVYPYPDLRIAYHTGIKLGAHFSYNGIRFYNDADMATQTMSIGDGDNNVRVNYALYSPIVYDLNDAGYYLDPNSTSELYKFSRNTLSRNSINSLQEYSPWATRAANSPEAGYTHRNGAMGWGNTDLNTIYSNWGGGIFDSWGSPANSPGGITHAVGFQAMHSNYQNGSQGHGWQMVSGEHANRFYWRNAWPTLNAWVEMLHTGNIGGNAILNQWGGNQSANFHISGSGRAGSDLRAPIFYDENNTGYYLDPNSVSNLAGITTSVNYNTFWTWTNLPGHHGIFSSTQNGAHFYPNNGSYGAWRVDGSRNGWNGLEFNSAGGNLSLMMNQGNGLGAQYSGVHNNSWGWLWYFYHQGLYASHFVDINDGNYYMDPNNGSRLAYLYYGIGAWNTTGWLNGIMTVPYASDGHQYNTGDWYGYVGNSGQAWWRMYSYGYVNASERHKKRDVHPIAEGLSDYVMDDIDRMNTYMYKYIKETDEMEEGNESKFRPQMHVGLIVDDAPDYLQDESFSGIDIYGTASLAIAGVKHNRKDIKELQQRLDKVLTSPSSDFGSARISQESVWVNYSPEFAAQLLEHKVVPSVTVTASVLGADIAVVDKSSQGFKVKHSGPAVVDFDWMAMAKVPVSQTNERTALPVSEDVKKYLVIEDSVKEKARKYRDEQNAKVEADRQRMAAEHENQVRQNEEGRVTPELHPHVNPADAAASEPKRPVTPAPLEDLAPQPEPEPRR